MKPYPHHMLIKWSPLKEVEYEGYKSICFVQSTLSEIKLDISSLFDLYFTVSATWSSKTFSPQMVTKITFCLDRKIHGKVMFIWQILGARVNNCMPDNKTALSNWYKDTRENSLNSVPQMYNSYCCAENLALKLGERSILTSFQMH